MTPKHPVHICVSDRPLAQLPGHLLRRLAMAPTPPTPLALVDQLVADHTVMVFSKTTCPFCTKIKAMFAEKSIKIEVLELDQLSEWSTVVVLPVAWFESLSIDSLSHHDYLSYYGIPV